MIYIFVTLYYFLGLHLALHILICFHRQYLNSVNSEQWQKIESKYSDNRYKIRYVPLRCSAEIRNFGDLFNYIRTEFVAKKSILHI